MPKSLSWPSTKGSPLAFLAALDLEAIGSVHTADWLPVIGKLLFFYDVAQQPWGFDPEDAGGWQVIYVDANASDLIELDPPNGLPKENILRKQTIDFRRIDVLPSWEREAISGLDLSDQELDMLSDIQSAVYGNEPHHQLGGFPDPVQADQMELECQLVTHGLYCGDTTGYEDPRAEELEKGTGDWRLLFQMDSDDDLDIMWGDAGMIYFWIRKQDALDKRFEKAWLVLQCG